ncbi:MAG: hypothetical protein IJ408_06260 [Clostridia bacterium]|nr:hypothetical protein [Clostridia bacterium]
MKKFRCPHCGEEGIPFIYKYIGAELTYRDFEMEEHIRPEKGRNCTKCNKPLAIRPRYNTLWFWALVALPILVLPVYFVLSLMKIVFIGWLLPLFPLMILLSHIILVTGCGYITVDRERFHGNMPMSNVNLELTDVKKSIHNFDIYTLKFDTRTENMRFRETFKGGRVPVVFYRKKMKQTFPIEAFIIKTEFIPENLYCKDSTFTLYDGEKQIAKGKIKTIFQ